MSSIDDRLSEPLKPFYTGAQSESDRVKSTLSTLNLQPHPEGGYFVETDRDFNEVPNPYLNKSGQNSDKDNKTRAASTSIYYFLTPKSPQGNFHRNESRTVHTLHRGRGRYVLIHADEVKDGAKARLETFIVGQNIEKGERLQWIVEGGKYKASYLLPSDNGSSDNDGLLISETVVPGFDYRDHDFLLAESFRNLVTSEQEKELSWLIRS